MALSKDWSEKREPQTERSADKNQEHCIAALGEG